LVTWSWFAVAWHVIVGLPEHFRAVMELLDQAVLGASLFPIEYGPLKYVLVQHYNERER
jgi:hypothetical protein